MLITSFLENSFLKNKTLGLAVSGGVDSMVMLDVFRKIYRQNNLKIYVLHYNHKWRKNSFKDGYLIKKYCEKYKLLFIYKEAEGRVIKNEETARKQRYSFFTFCTRKYKLNMICTAHHNDDQAETIIFRLARGTGPRGLLPIKEYIIFNKNLSFYRPFLYINKDEILSYSIKNRIPFLEDKTNKDIKYKRNLIRHKIIPYLKEINISAPGNIVSCAGLAYAHDFILDKHFLKMIKNISIKSKNVWSRKKFLKLNLYMQKALIYWFLGRLKTEGNLSKIPLIRDAIYNKRIFDLSNNLRLIINDNSIFFKEKSVSIKKPKKNKHKKLHIGIYLNGKKQKYFISNGNYFLVKPVKGNNHLGIFPKDKQMTAYVNLSNFKRKKLILRNRKPQDIFKPLGFPHVVKLKKYLINKKIPKQKRDKMPLLCFKNEILWMPGYSVSEKIKVANKHTHILKMV